MRLHLLGQVGHFVLQGPSQLNPSGLLFLSVNLSLLSESKQITQQSPDQNTDNIREEQDEVVR